MDDYAGTINAAQRAVLEWVAEGCPAGRFEGYAHRTSAAALRTRELVRISGRGPSWRAELTEAGRRYLGGLAVDGQEDAAAEREPPVAARLSKTEQFAADLVAAGGVLQLPLRYGKGGGGPSVRQRAYAAQDAGKLPPGKRLTTRVIGDELEIRLVDAGNMYEGVVPDLVPIAVPERVGRLHPVARTFRDARDRHEVSKELLPRATRMVHLIAVEADRRGWTPAVPSESKNGYGRTDWTGTKDGHVTITADGHLYRLRIQEEGSHTRGPWEADVHLFRNSSTTSWTLGGVKRERPTGPYDAKATGRLKLKITDRRWWHRDGRQSNWGDRQSWTLEDRLPHLFREIEIRAADATRAADEAKLAAERAAEQARREAEERERRWPSLMEQARVDAIDAHRAKELRAQSDAWLRTEQLRRYCAALQAAHGDHAPTVAWLSWVREYIERVDPLACPPSMPRDPELKAEDLQPYLPAGWSPYGPEAAAGRW